MREDQEEPPPTPRAPQHRIQFLLREMPRGFRFPLNLCVVAELVRQIQDQRSILFAVLWGGLQKEWFVAPQERGANCVVLAEDVRVIQSSTTPSSVRAPFQHGVGPFLLPVYSLPEKYTYALTTQTCGTV